jgi:hypothetical protein
MASLLTDVFVVVGVEQRDFGNPAKIYALAVRNIERHHSYLL